MRGKARLWRPDWYDLRITPAYAGKRRRKSELPETLQDHPRLCGEKFAHLLLCYHNLGSPPPMRGKGRRSFFDRDFHRITPAYAGKSRRSQEIFQRREDHPRLCGEK